MEKIKGNEIFWQSNNKNVSVCYSQFDLGAKYKVYRKVFYTLDDGTLRKCWEFLISFSHFGEAVSYAKRDNDLKIIR